MSETGAAGPAAADRSAPVDGRPADEAPDATVEGIGSSVSALWSAMADRVRHTFELAAAELRLAALTWLTMLVLILLGIAAILAGWLLMVLALAGLAVKAGMPWPAVAGVLAAVHFAGGALLFRSVTRMSRDLTLPATREALGSTERRP